MGESPKSILIVEDELIIALMIKKMVERMGHTVLDTITSGREAVEAAQELSPDLILMDIRLQGEMDGIEAMKEIHRTTNIPVIYITGNTDSVYKDKIKDSDHVGFLSKPITFSELTRTFDFAS